jgi:A/G-specific adenine glycosylase
LNALTLLPDLLDWYRASHRPFPWREGRPDPYSVWIVEVMSQQSTMASVLPYYERWKRVFPSLESLADAPEEDVLKAWAGLGYYSRARNVHRAAKELRDYRAAHGGRWPPCSADWLELPGVGPYTAAAVAAIALDEAVLPVDGNLVRVFSRLEGIGDALNSGADRRRVEAAVAVWAERAPPQSHGRLAQAFMDLGALVCRPGTQARCEVCPLRSGCAAYREGRVAEIPRAKARKETRKIRVLALVYRHPQSGEALVRRIPEGRRLQGQWELPQWELGEEQLNPRFFSDVGRHFEIQGPVKHSITHHAYEVWKVEAGTWKQGLPEDHAWAPEVGPLTTLTRKVLALADLS